MESGCFTRSGLAIVLMTAALSGCTVPMGALRPGPVTAIDATVIPATDARALSKVRGEWMRFDFDSNMDYARLIRRRELNLYVRLRWCGTAHPGREITIARLFGEDGRVSNLSRLAPIPGSQPGSPVIFRYHTYIPVFAPKGPLMPPGSTDQGGDYDLRHPAHNLCVSVAGGDMVGNHGESTILVYPTDVVRGVAH